MVTELKEERSKVERYGQQIDKMRYTFWKDKVNLSGYADTLEGKIKEFQEAEAEKDSTFKIGKKSKNIMQMIRRPTMGNIMDIGHVVKNVHYFD